VVVVAHGRTVASGTAAALSARVGETDFEETFVRLAFGAGQRHAADGDASVAGGRP
jgi:sodium transport system ATP-binding protein